MCSIIFATDSWLRKHLRLTFPHRLAVAGDDHLVDHEAQHVGVHHRTNSRPPHRRQDGLPGNKTCKAFPGCVWFEGNVKKNFSPDLVLVPDDNLREGCEVESGGGGLQAGYHRGLPVLLNHAAIINIILLLTLHL
jgi:hypothetical protein